MRSDWSKKKLLLIIIPLAIVLVLIGVLLAGYFIRRNTPTGIRVVSVSHKTEYYVGDKLDTENLVVELYAKDRTLRYLDAEEYDVQGFDSSQAGDYILVVVYQDFSTEYDITVKELPAEKPSYLSLEIYTMPTKTQYKVGEMLDVTGGILQINYTDGSYRRVQLMPLMTSGFTSESVGVVQVRVDYLGMTAYFEVEVVQS